MELGMEAAPACVLVADLDPRSIDHAGPILMEPQFPQISPASCEQRRLGREAGARAEASVLMSMVRPDSV